MSAEITSALAQFAISSVGMMVGNKLAVSHMLGLPTTLVIIQVIGTLALLGLYSSKVEGIKGNLALKWLPVAALFSLMIFTSLKSFVFVNVSTVIIFRNIASILTTIAEYFVRGVTVNAKIVLAEVCILAGAYMYGTSQGATFNWTGFYWVMANVCSQVAYGVLLRMYMDQPTFGKMSKYTMSFYNNTLALPFLICIWFLQGEDEKALSATSGLTQVERMGWFWVVVTCGLGFLISTSGFGLQKLVSATTFLVINNLSKFLNILLGVLFLNDKLQGPMAMGGCALAIGSGMAYSYFTMEMNDAKKKQKEQAAGKTTSSSASRNDASSPQGARKGSVTRKASKKEE